MLASVCVYFSFVFVKPCLYGINVTINGSYVMTAIVLAMGTKRELFKSM